MRISSPKVPRSTDPWSLGMLGAHFLTFVDSDSAATAAKAVAATMDNLTPLRLTVKNGWKILVKIDSFPKVRGENQKYWKPPPSCPLIIFFFGGGGEPLLTKIFFYEV